MSKNIAGTLSSRLSSRSRVGSSNKANRIDVVINNAGRVYSETLIDSRLMSVFTTPLTKEIPPMVQTDFRLALQGTNEIEITVG